MSVYVRHRTVESTDSDPGTDDGPIIDTLKLARLLAYPSASAIRQAHRRGSLPVPLFRVGARRRLFARLKDVQELLRNGLQQDHPPAPYGASTPTEDS